MDTTILVESGEAIGYAVVGVIALLGFLLIHLVRRRSDLKKARTAVRLASLSLNEPRQGPVAISSTYRESKTDRWLDWNGQRIAIEGAIEVAAGSKARWQGGVRTYIVRDGEPVIAIGVMSKKAGWALAPSPAEPGVLLYATKPAAAPAPLLPWRAPLFLAICGAIGFFGLYGAGTVLLDVSHASDANPCDDNAQLRYGLAAAIPQFGIRDQALHELQVCAKP